MYIFHHVHLQMTCIHIVLFGVCFHLIWMFVNFFDLVASTMSLQAGTPQSSPGPRASRRTKGPTYASPVSEVGMWKARSISAQNVLDEKSIALDTFRDEQVNSIRIDYQHVVERTSTIRSLLAHMSASVEGWLTALGPERTHRLIEGFHQVSSEVDGLREACGKVSSINDREVSLLNDVIKSAADVRLCLRNRAEVGELEYRKLLQSCERQDAMISQARTYVKVCIAERLAWQQDQGINPAKLPILGGSFVDRCKRALDSLSDVQESHMLPSVATLETADDSSRRFLVRANEKLTDGSALLRYTSPEEELKLLDEALKSSGSDVALHKELADRERRFERSKEDLSRHCVAAIQSLGLLRSTLQDLRDQFSRSKRDGFIENFSARILSALSSSGPSASAPELGQDSSFAMEKSVTRRREGLGSTASRRSVSQATPQHISTSPRSRGSRLMSSSISAVLSLVSPKRSQSTGLRSSQKQGDPIEVPSMGESSEAQFTSLTSLVQPSPSEQALVNPMSLPVNLSWKSPSMSVLDPGSADPTPRSTSPHVSPRDERAVLCQSASLEHPVGPQPSNSKRTIKASSSKPSCVPKWDPQTPVDEEFANGIERPVPSSIQLVFDEIENPSIQPSIEHHRISQILRRGSETSQKVEEAMRRANALQSAVRSFSSSTVLKPSPPDLVGREFSQRIAPPLQASPGEWAKGNQYTLQRTASAPKKHP